MLVNFNLANILDEQALGIPNQGAVFFLVINIFLTRRLPLGQPICETIG